MREAWIKLRWPHAWRIGTTPKEFWAQSRYSWAKANNRPRNLASRQ